MIPRYLRLIKMCTSDALCHYNKTKNICDKMIYNILSDAQWKIECSYRKHKKIGDPVVVLREFIENLMKNCEKSRLLYRTMGTKKVLAKYKSSKSAFKRLVKVYEEMSIEIEECNFNWRVIVTWTYFVCINFLEYSFFILGFAIYK